MKRFTEMVEACAKQIEEVFPWDLCERMQQHDLLLIDVREPYEFEALRIDGSPHGGEKGRS